MRVTMAMRMRNRVLPLAILTLGMTLTAAAKDEMQGTLISENSVQCGSQAKNKKQTMELMCQEYVIRTDTTEYHVRQEKKRTRPCCR